jgi:hypothetical protein
VMRIMILMHQPIAPVSIINFHGHMMATSGTPVLEHALGSRVERPNLPT